MSDILVDIGAIEQQAPSTSPQPSLAHSGKWIRSDTRRYTQQGAAPRVLNFISSTALAPPTSKSEHVPTPVLRRAINNHRLQKPPPPGAGAPQRAPPSVRTLPSAAYILQTLVPSDLVVCRQHTQATRKPKTTQQNSTPLIEPHSTTMSSTPDLLPTYKQVLLRPRPANAPSGDLYNPRTRLA
jgi:hypothetical protein